MKLLAGDVGGTKCLLAICDEGGAILESRRYPSAGFASFEDVLRAFARDVGELPLHGAFAIAGPVDGDACRTTNLPWLVDARAIEAALGLRRARLVNDFTAQALAVTALGEGDRVELHGGAREPRGVIAILGAGTGLGEAIVAWAGDSPVVLPSEGGHVDFAPVDERQAALWRWLRARHGRVSYERVLSGPGLVSIYEHLRDAGRAESPAVRAAMAEGDPAAVVSRFGQERGDPLCDEALEIFCEIYGQEAGNLALKVLPRGGVFVCGGIAPKILGRLREGPFLRRYVDKGRLSPVVERTPVYVVTHPESGLFGAAIAARELLEAATSRPRGGAGVSGAA